MSCLNCASKYIFISIAILKLWLIVEKAAKNSESIIEIERLEINMSGFYIFKTGKPKLKCVPKF